MSSHVCWQQQKTAATTTTTLTEKAEDNDAKVEEDETADGERLQQPA
jgi:hypothetical protein